MRKHVSLQIKYESNMEGGEVCKYQQGEVCHLMRSHVTLASEGGLLQYIQVFQIRHLPRISLNALKISGFPDLRIQ
jgi:hypothetical protein